MRQKAVTFQADDLNFEGVVAEPDEAAGPVPGVVICHPGPRNGGNMDNNVVLSYRMLCGSPPRKAKPETWPSENALVSEGYSFTKQPSLWGRSKLKPR